MITLKPGSGSPRKVYDHKPLKDHLRKIGLSSQEFENLNKFCYAALPEGSHGTFLIAADNISDLTPLQTTITLEIQGATSTFSHKNLRVTKIRQIERNVYDQNDTGKLAIVEVSDLWALHDTIIRRDYNRTSYLLPAASQEFSTYPNPQETWSTILNAILTNYPSDSAATLDSSGLPSEYPMNLLSAGSTVKDFFQYVADAHFLVCYYDKDTTGGGKVVLTDNQQSSSDIPSTAQNIFSSYGHSVASNTLDVTFSTQFHHYAKMRAEILAEYWEADDFGNQWERDTGDISPNNDFLARNDRLQGSGFSFDHYYPFYSSGTYDTANSEAQSIFDKLKVNYEKRSRREGVIGFKDIIVLNPSLDVQKIEYALGDSGITTFLYTSPPRNISVKPEANHAARGLEYVPPMLYGIVKVPSGANPLGGYAPNSEAELTLPAENGLDSYDIPIFNRSTQQMFEGDTVYVHYSLQKKKYVFLNLCERLWQYELQSNWFGGLAVAFRLTPEGVNTGKLVIVRDPLAIFDYLEAGDRGWMIYTTQDAFYAIQAPCEETAGGGTPPVGNTGACLFEEGCIEGVSDVQCSSMGGTYLGNGSSCP